MAGSTRSLLGRQRVAGIAESAARLALLAQRQGDLQRSREWLSEARAAADASDDPETLQYIRKVTAQIEQ